MTATFHLRDCTSISTALGTICTAENSQYGYNVALAPGVIFTVIFSILFLLTVIQTFFLYRHNRSPYMILVAICALGEMGGWASRIYSAGDEFDFNGYVAQLVMLIISPVFVSAATYIIFCRIMDILGHQWSRLPRKAYIGTFVGALRGAAGGGLSATANTPASSNTGRNIMIAGVSIQVVVTGIFFSLLVDYCVRRHRTGKFLSKQLRMQLSAVVIATAAIMIRCVFRVVEMSQGWKGYLALHEGYLIGFDGVPLTIAILMLVLFHPSKCLSQAASSASSEMEKGSLAG